MSDSPVRDLVERLLLDQHERWRRGERVSVETYLQRHPSLTARPEELLDLVYQEIFLREQRGEAPALDEYLGRFPDLAAPLQVQFDLHHALKPADFLPSLDGPPSVRPTRDTDPIGRPVIPGYDILGEL